MTEHDHRYTYAVVRKAKEDAEEQKRFHEATYWLLQQVAIEHREEARERHDMSIFMEVTLAVIALASLIVMILEVAR